MLSIRLALTTGSLVLLLAGAGCGTAEPEPAEGPAAETSEAVTAPQDQQELIRYGSETAKKLGWEIEWTGDYDDMVARRVIRVLVVYSKTYYFLDGFVQRGATYDGLKLFEDWVNKEAGTSTLKVHVIPVPVTRDRLLPALNEGLGDIAASGITITPERKKLVDFSDPFLSDVKEIVVTGPSAPALGSIDDLSGKEIYVRTSSSYRESLEELNRSFQQAGKPLINLTPAEEYLEDEDLLEMVNAGLIETVVVDEHKAEFWDQIYENIVLHPDIAVRTQGAIGWAFRKGSPKLAETINRFVAKHKKGTLMGNITLKRYLKDTKRIKNVLAETDKARYADTVRFFEKYATQYGFDTLMVVAQGYQESGLDQNLVSHRGAVGIMQLLPSTAADKSVGIPDIKSADNNVHAGIKYMRWIRDTYFNDGSVDDINKTLFSFASYNAGPNRIRGLRNKAAERGLDRNIWFRNVEIIASEDIGRETVDYVSNIYKYYAAYKLLEEREQIRRNR
jgi:membrane-bound lytic murein transglycosylase MltF